MTRRERNRIMTAINKKFSELGKDMPQSTSNISPAAWEYAIASHLSSLCSGRVKNAKATAMKEGVLPDYEDNPLPPGEYKPIFDGEHVAIDLTVRQPSKTVDSSKLFDFLLGAGVSEDLLNKGMEHASRVSRPAHVFSSYIKVEDGDE
jgi:hypothetical protein